MRSRRPGAGTIVQLFAEKVEVELGKTIAYVAETPDELAAIDADAEDRPAPRPAAGDRKATRKAAELAELHGIDLAVVGKRGFITEKDVEELIAQQKASETPETRPALAGVSTEGVTLPASFDLDESVGVIDAVYLESVRADPDAFRSLSSDEKIAALREHGAQIGEGVGLGAETLVVAPRIVVEDGVQIGPRGTVICEEVVAIGELSQFGADLELRCRRAFLGAGIWAGRAIRFGEAGIAIRGRRSAWATLRSSATRPSSTSAGRC